MSWVPVESAGCLTHEARKFIVVMGGRWQTSPSPLDPRFPLSPSTPRMDDAEALQPNIQRLDAVLESCPARNRNQKQNPQTW